MLNLTLRIKHWLYDYHLVVTCALTLVIFAVWWHVDNLQVGSFLIPAVAAILGFSYFILKLHSDETRMFKKLYKEFNERYEVFHADLNRIRVDPEGKDLSDTEKLVLFKYFNLCAEEFLYYRKGYIYPEVWSAWVNGMATFCESSRISKLWEEELRTGSYYGMSLPKKQSVKD